MRRWAFTSNLKSTLNLSVPDFNAASRVIANGTDLGINDYELGFGFCFWPDSIVGTNGILTCTDSAAVFQLEIYTIDDRLYIRDLANAQTDIGQVHAGPMKIWIFVVEDRYRSFIRNMTTGATVETSDLKIDTPYLVDKLFLGRDVALNPSNGYIWDVFFGDTESAGGENWYLDGGIFILAPLGHHYWPLREGSGNTCFSSSGTIHMLNSEGGGGGIVWYDPDPRNPRRWV